MSGVYNPPLIQVEVGHIKDGGERRLRYVITGTDHIAISKALETMGFVFDYIVQASGILVFRGPNQQKAWYHQAYNRVQADHNSTKETP